MDGLKLLRCALLALCIVVFLGCSGVNSLKYGKLNAMQVVLDEASVNCADEASRSRAINWAMVGIRDLTENNDYLERGGEEYRRTKNLVSHLTLVASRRNNNIQTLCHNISSAAQAAKQYLRGDGEQKIASITKD